MHSTSKDDLAHKKVRKFVGCMEYRIILQPVNNNKTNSLMSKITKINSERPVAENLQHQLFQLLDIQGKRVELSYSRKDISCDGGLLLLRKLEK
ncbi:MAG: hypothetical protein GY760_29200 [Deltaproteobacteria bacterium]|nr:hypothetical protein [Deltaproteobacteria bacterium]